MIERYVIHVTKLCNCRCVYCYEKDKISTYTWEEIKQLIDEIVKYNKLFGIEFLGGEPMLAFDLILKAYHYLENIPYVNVVDYVITTNGTILPDVAFDFLLANPKVKFGVSLDGTKYMNQMRLLNTIDPATDGYQNTYDLAIANITRLLSALPENSDRLNVHMVTHNMNVHSLHLGVKHLYSKGVRHIGIGTIETTMEIGKEYVELFIREMDKVSIDIINGNLPNLMVDILSYIKPSSDVRHYMYDDNGKLIGESYGRAPHDIIENGSVDARAVQSKTGDLIDTLRQKVYNNHNDRKGGYNGIID